MMKLVGLYSSGSAMQLPYHTYHPLGTSLHSAWGGPWSFAGAANVSSNVVCYISFPVVVMGVVLMSRICSIWLWLMAPPHPLNTGPHIPKLLPRENTKPMREGREERIMKGWTNSLAGRVPSTRSWKIGNRHLNSKDAAVWAVSPKIEGWSGNYYGL